MMANRPTKFEIHEHISAIKIPAEAATLVWTADGMHLFLAQFEGKKVPDSVLFFTEVLRRARDEPEWVDEMIARFESDAATKH